MTADLQFLLDINRASESFTEANHKHVVNTNYLRFANYYLNLTQPTLSHRKSQQRVYRSCFVFGTSQV